MIAEIATAAIATVNPGDQIYLPHLGLRTVASNEPDDAGRWWLTYFSSEEVSYENKARVTRAPRMNDRLVEHSITHSPADRPLAVVRGNKRTATTLHRELERRLSEELARQQARSKSDL